VTFSSQVVSFQRRLYSGCSMRATLGLLSITAMRRRVSGSFVSVVGVEP
jgi:hypothetical protein